MADLSEKNRELQAMVKAATAQTAAVVRDRDALKEQQNKRLESLQKIQESIKPGTKVQVDLFGGGLALVSAELISWGARAAGDWSKDGFWGRNQDLMQAIPHITLGTIIYIAELCTRDKIEKKLPSKWQMVFSEAAKLLAYSGFGNLATAIRYRIAKGRQMASDNAALQAELAALKAAQGK